MSRWNTFGLKAEWSTIFLWKTPFSLKLHWAVWTCCDCQHSGYCCHHDLPCQGDAASSTALLLLTEGNPKIYIFYKIGLFLSQDTISRGKAKLLLLRPPYCKKTYHSAFTDMLWNHINHSDNMILVKIKALNTVWNKISSVLFIRLLTHAIWLFSMGFPIVRLN